LSWEIHAAKAQSRKNAEQNRQELQRKPTFVFVRVISWFSNLSEFVNLPGFCGHLERPGMILSGEEVFMSAKQRKYTREFKLEAVRLVQKGNSAVRVAEQLGIRCDMLRHWKQQVESNELGETEVFPGKGRVANAEQEVRRLRRELELVTQERTDAHQGQSINFAATKQTLSSSNNHLTGLRPLFGCKAL
jgi:transposase